MHDWFGRSASEVALRCPSECSWLAAYQLRRHADASEGRGGTPTGHNAVACGCTSATRRASRTARSRERPRVTSGLGEILVEAVGLRDVVLTFECYDRRRVGEVATWAADRASAAKPRPSPRDALINSTWSTLALLCREARRRTRRGTAAQRWPRRNVLCGRGSRVW